MKVCQVIFSTNRINFLTKTLESQKKNLDYTGVDLVKKIFIDDYPLGRDNEYITQLAKSYGFTDIVLHEKNMGITSTWQEAFDIIKSVDCDYILNTEDDVELLIPIKVLDVIELLQKDNTLSQINLKRNAWYSTEANDPKLTPEDKEFKNYLYEKNHKYFWSLFSIYPKWIALEDYKKEYNSCPSEGVLAYHLINKYKLYTGLLKTKDGSHIVEHIGEYSKGKRCNENEPGWDGFKHQDPEKLYDSRTGVEIVDLNKAFRTSFLVVDNFYCNPDEVRNFALTLDFNVKGNYPGNRTIPAINDGIKQSIQNLILPHAGQITDWFEKDGLTGSFQLALSSDRTWIHTDEYNTWSGVCYLTPNAPLSGGTAFYRHKKTGKYLVQPTDVPSQFDGYDRTTWEMTDYVANVYNRLVLFRGRLFHASQDYFGTDKNTGRLFQVFFFNTQH